MSATSDKTESLPERRSKCAEESRRFVEARSAHLAREEQEEQLRKFNADLASLIHSGRLRK